MGAELADLVSRNCSLRKFIPYPVFYPATYPNVARREELKVVLFYGFVYKGSRLAGILI
jgi:hypothetical protein